MDFLTTKDVADYFGVSVATARGYIEVGSVVRRGGGRVVVRLKAVMHPAGLRVRERDLAAFERELTEARLGRDGETERRRDEVGKSGVGKELVMGVAFPDGERPRLVG